MQFEFENLGAIDSAKVEISPLTIICGRNNTGKTYITYAIYALLSSWRELIDWRVPKEIMEEIQSSGAVLINMNEHFVKNWDSIKNTTNENWKNYLSHALAAPSERFADTKLSFDLTINDLWKESGFKKDFRSEKGKILFTAEKPENSEVVALAALGDENDFPWFALESFINQALVESVLSRYMPGVFMASTERTGAVAFKEELNLTKNKIVQLLTKMESNKETHLHPGKLFEAIYKRGYPLPVESNVQFVNRFSSIEGRTSSFIDTNREIIDDFEKIVGGNYETDKDGVTRFIPYGSRIKLSLSEASSAVRSLVVFWYWLKTTSTLGDALLIDEPELNLHPENQRSFARLLAKLVNLGIKVIITTHSDTIIREFNTLIMLSSDKSHISEVRRKFGYSENEKINPSDVCLYIANGRPRTPTGRAKRNTQATLEKITSDGTLGLSAEIFDSTIIEMGEIQENLRYGVI